MAFDGADELPLRAGFAAPASGSEAYARITAHLANMQGSPSPAAGPSSSASAGLHPERAQDVILHTQ